MENDIFLLDFGNSAKSNSTDDILRDLQYAVFNLRYLMNLDGRFLSAGYYRDVHAKYYPLERIFNDLPPELGNMMRYVYSLKEVEYEGIKILLRDYLVKRWYSYDGKIIWPRSTVIV